MVFNSKTLSFGRNLIIWF